MPQKVVPQAHALGGALDQPGDVRDHERVFVLPRDAQIGLQRGKVVVCDLGLRRRHYREHRRLAHVGEADQPHVGDGFQFKQKLPGAGALAGLGEVGGLTGGSGEPGVAKAAVAAPEHHAPLAVFVKVRHHAAGLLVLYDGAAGHFNLNGSARLALAAGRRPIFAILRLKEVPEAEVHQRIHALGGDKHHVAAPPSVPAVRAALLHELFAVEGHAAVAAVPRLAFDGNHIHKKRHDLLLKPFLWYYCPF